jgi:hypothetical protein
VRRGLIHLANQANEQLSSMAHDSLEHEHKLTYLVEIISIKRRLDQLITAGAHE